MSDDRTGQYTDETERTGDPHQDDFCVVCKQGVEVGVTMYPVVGIENGCVCEACINNASKHFRGRP